RTPGIPVLFSDRGETVGHGHPLDRPEQIIHVAESDGAIVRHAAAARPLRPHATSTIAGPESASIIVQRLANDPSQSVQAVLDHGILGRVGAGFLPTTSFQNSSLGTRWCNYRSHGGLAGTAEPGCQS